MASSRWPRWWFAGGSSWIGPAAKADRDKRGDMRPKTAAVQMADGIAKGDVPIVLFAPLKAVIVCLKNELEFGCARKVIARALARDGEAPPRLAAPFSPDQGLWLVQQLALCTYKDEDLLPATRFRDALTLLDEIHL